MQTTPNDQMQRCPLPCKPPPPPPRRYPQCQAHENLRSSTQHRLLHVMPSNMIHAPQNKQATHSTATCKHNLCFTPSSSSYHLHPVIASKAHSVWLYSLQCSEGSYIYWICWSSLPVVTQPAIFLYTPATPLIGSTPHTRQPFNTHVRAAANA